MTSCLESGLQLKGWSYHLVIVMATVEDGNPEAIWIAPAVARIETHTMVTVRYDYIGVPQSITKRGDHSTEFCNLQSQDATALCLIQRKYFRSTVKVCLIRNSLMYSL